MSDDLIARSRLALDEVAEQQRQAKGRRVSGLSPKTYQGYDATQGQVILRDATGGQANAITQGSLSNAAIQAGDRVSPYGWEVADWRPALADFGEVEPTAVEDNIGDKDEQDAADPDQPSDVPDGTPPLTPPAEQQPYCSCQVLWARGTPQRTDDGISPEAAAAVGEYLAANSPRGWVQYHTWSEAPNSISFIDPPDNDPTTSYTNGAPCLEPFGTTRLKNGAPDGCMNNPSNGILLNTEFVFSGSQDGSEPPQLSPPADNPPLDTDPGEWTEVKSCSPPIKYRQSGGGNVVIWDATSSEAQPLRVLGYDPDDRIEVFVRCSEEGPPP